MADIKKVCGTAAKGLVAVPLVGVALVAALVISLLLLCWVLLALCWVLLLKLCVAVVALIAAVVICDLLGVDPLVGAAAWMLFLWPLTSTRAERRLARYLKARRRNTARRSAHSES